MNWTPPPFVNPAMHQLRLAPVILACGLAFACSATRCPASPPGETLVSLRAAVEHLNASFADDYPRGPEFLERIARLEQRLQGAKKRDRTRLNQELQSLQREALLANPLVSSQPILFVVRKQYRSDHHNTATMFQTGEINTASFDGGSALKIIDLAHDGEVTTLLEVPEGVVRDPEVSFDGRRILVSLRQNIARQLPSVRHQRGW